jgi:hypothetical protein
MVAAALAIVVTSLGVQAARVSRSYDWRYGGDNDRREEVVTRPPPLTRSFTLRLMVAGEMEFY